MVMWFSGLGVPSGVLSHHAWEACPAGGDVQRGFGVRIVGAGCGHQVSLVVLARRHVGPCGGSVRDGGFAAGDFGTEVTDGEVDGTAPAGFGGDGGPGTGGVGGFVRVGASHVGCARGCGRRESWERRGRRRDGGAEDKRSGDGQGMSCLHHVYVLEIVDETARWGSHARETAPIQR